MKKFLMPLFLAFIAVLSTNAVVYSANSGDPSAVNMKIYKTWVSANTDCSNATLIFSDDNPSYQNMVNNPTLGTATVPNGTYACVVIKMSDVITGTPNYTSTGGNCTPSTNIQIDVFRSPDTSTCPDSTTVNGSGSDSSPVEDGPCLYMSTSGNDSNVGWLPNSPFPLTAPFEVSAATTGTFVSDFSGKVLDEGSSCGIDPPQFGFR